MSVVVRSAHGRTILTLAWSSDAPDSLTVELHDDGLRVLAPAYYPGMTPAERGLPEFFTDLAHSWRGWQGVRKWESLEGELTIEATADRSGHITLLVRVQNGAPFRWRAEAKLAVDAGQLDELAAQAHGLGHAPAT